MDKEVFRCQSCRAKLKIGGMDSLPGPDAPHSAGFNNTANSTVGGSKVDDSFIVLEGGSRKGAQGACTSLE